MSDSPSTTKVLIIPPKWLGLHTIASSNRTRFWSAELPRTYSLLEKSELPATAGDRNAARITSGSPAMEGNWWAMRIGTFETGAGLAPLTTTVRPASVARSVRTVSEAGTTACKSTGPWGDWTGIVESCASGRTSAGAGASPGTDESRAGGTRIEESKTTESVCPVHAGAQAASRIPRPWESLGTETR